MTNCKTETEQRAEHARAVDARAGELEEWMLDHGAEPAGWTHDLLAMAVDDAARYDRGNEPEAVTLEDVGIALDRAVASIDALRAFGAGDVLDRDRADELHGRCLCLDHAIWDAADAAALDRRGGPCRIVCL